MTVMNSLLPQIILWGGTGQVKILRPIVERLEAQVVAVFDDTPDLAPPFDDVPLLHGSEFPAWLEQRLPEEVGFLIAIGNPHGDIRIRLHQELQSKGLTPATVAHETAWVAANARIGSGSQLCAGAKVMEETRLGVQCIINTNASVDHECELGEGTEVAPGGTLCGLVRTGSNVWIGAGATVLPRIRIGDNAIVGAGATVTRNVDAGVTVVGTPARPVRKGERI